MNSYSWLKRIRVVAAIGMWFLLMGCGGGATTATPAPTVPEEVTTGLTQVRPEDCDPDNPLALVSLEQEGFEIQDGESEIDGADLLFVDYVNQDGLTFKIKVHSQDGSAASDYLANLKVCFEVVDAGQSLIADVTSLPLDAILLQSTSEQTDISLEALVAQREEYLVDSQGQGAVPNMNGYLEWHGYDDPQGLVEPVQQSARDAIAGSGLDTARAQELENWLSPYYETTFNEDGELTVLMPEPTDTLSDSDFLAADPEHLVIDFEWVDAPDGGTDNFAVFYILDPPIPANKTHRYRAKYERYVEAQISASGGSLRLYMQRYSGSTYSYSNRDCTIDYADNIRSRKLIGGCSSCTTYYWFRIKVYNPSTVTARSYTMYGSWVVYPYNTYTEESGNTASSQGVVACW